MVCFVIANFNYLCAPRASQQAKACGGRSRMVVSVSAHSAICLSILYVCQARCCESGPWPRAMFCTRVYSLCSMLMLCHTVSYHCGGINRIPDGSRSTSQAVTVGTVRAAHNNGYPLRNIVYPKARMQRTCGKICPSRSSVQRRHMRSHSNTHTHPRPQAKRYPSSRSTSLHLSCSVHPSGNPKGTLAGRSPETNHLHIPALLPEAVDVPFQQPRPATG